MARKEAAKPVGIPIDQFLTKIQARGVVADTAIPPLHIIDRWSHAHVDNVIDDIIGLVRPEQLEYPNEFYWWQTLTDTTTRFFQKLTYKENTTISKVIFGYRREEKKLDVVVIDHSRATPVSLETHHPAETDRSLAEYARLVEFSGRKVIAHVYPESMTRLLSDQEVLARLNGGDLTQYIATLTNLLTGSLTRIVGTPLDLLATISDK